jgi:biotin-dependent carboxylase-like uncharacterized protein
MIDVLGVGVLLTVQDLGRPGYAAIGVPRSGAMDRAALCTANRLVGNPEEAAGLEALMGCRLRLRDAATIAITGAATDAVSWGQAVSLPAGAVLDLAAPTHGLRHYIAVRGGIDVPATLGSRSTDTLSGLGPAPLQVGDTLAVGAPPTTAVSAAHAIPAAADEVVLRVSPGPRTDWFEQGAMSRLTSATWRVRPESDRIGLRLDGPAIARVRPQELASEPMIPGALQIPPDGRPILFGPDSPVTGGYPVIAVVREDDLGRIAQVRPGEALRFTLARR